MGVPAFFRWLSRKYPSVIIECVEQKTVDDQGNVVYENMSAPNPNRVEFDNLYLDMNGIIHPCTHPEDKPAPRNEDEMMIAIFECIDRLMNIVRPRKVLYMAIDGVAPRAKMNQQRSRRFRASKETAEKAAEVARIREELAAKGAILPPEKEKGSHFDSNCITPGTPFMDRLSKCLQYYVHDRMNNNPGWKNLKVILSDANVPGEGEHKIMDYIRKQRVQPDYDPNTHHVLCGADADLIMLGLATHETHFTIIREEFLPNKDRPCDICQQMGHEMKSCAGLQSERELANRTPPAPGKETQYIFVRLNVLKEYLQKELDMPNLPFAYDFERVLDDWVFMCFFVGNDFLPHLPSLEIRENAIDRLVTLYKKCVYKTQGYLTDSGSVLLERVEMIMTDLGYAEDEIFRQRKVSEDRFKERNKRMRLQKEREQRPNFQHINNSQFAPTPLGRGVQPQAIVNPRQEAAHFRMLGQGGKAKDEAATATDTGADQQGPRGVKRKPEEPLAVTVADDEEKETPDEVRLWEDGFKDRYYESKFDVMPQNIKFRQTVAWEYVRGLCWVLQYYYQGCASWEWYFPYHYAPFASDLKHLENVDTHFDRGTPFKPLQQLMGVFPAASRSHVPPAFAELMVDPRSPIIDFYPIDFRIDLNGKKFAWQGVALLPFVDEKRLFKATDPKVPLLTVEERLRNENGDAKLFVLPGSAGYKTLAGLYVGEDVDYEREMPVTVDHLQGFIIPTKENVPREGMLPSPIPGLAAVTENQVLTVRFQDPKFADGFVFPARKLENAKDQPKVLGANDGPVIGFGQRNDRASLGSSGHRMLNNRLGLGYGGGAGGGRGGYGNNNDDGGRRNNNYQGGYNNNNNRNNGRGGGSHNNYNSGYNNNDGNSTYSTGGQYNRQQGGQQRRQGNGDESADNVTASAPSGSATGNRSVFEQLSSQIQQYQQQMMNEISRNTSTPSQSTTGASNLLPNPFANQVQYDYNNHRSNSSWTNNNGGRNNNNRGGRGGGGGGGGGRQFHGGGGGGGNHRNNNNNNNRYGQNNYGSGGGGGGGGNNRFNNQRRQY
ncbi:5'-3' exoribonuclease 2 homolog [Anopheles maculipalpis]|uniref:5'-3' exoribonuclease 2 homolog n=1 Tax=Anopheles maculipalpis TaxID=1496333 RepID=UPI002158C239|nr:5'-3' exoribonuclease 2 homolog [Anopheles maculipalpis]